MAGTHVTNMLDARDAARAALWAQGMLGPRPRRDPAQMLRRLGAVQLDTISVLARSHELVAYARLPGVTRASIEQAYWGSDSETFEYWSHAACILPLEDWPLYGTKRRAWRERGRRWHRLEDAERSCRYVIDRLRAEGPLTARELGGAKRGGPWWDWSEVKIAAEWLLDIGEVVCRARTNFQRVYDLAERAVPVPLHEVELDDEACAAGLVASAGRALGVATAADIGAYRGLPRAVVEQVAERAGLIRTSVEDWAHPAFVAPGSLDVLDRRVRGRSVLVSPFDSLIWDRPRTERVFGFRHRLEAYVPRDKRVYGYFAMPVLGGDRFVGLVDPRREGRTLVAKQVSLETRDAARHVAAALADAATWVDCDSVVVERVSPPETAEELAWSVAGKT